MTVQTTDDTNVRRIFNARPPNHTPTAISDTMVLRFHIAILKKRHDKVINYCDAESKG